MKTFTDFLIETDVINHPDINDPEFAKKAAAEVERRKKKRKQEAQSKKVDAIFKGNAIVPRKNTSGIAKPIQFTSARNGKATPQINAGAAPKSTPKTAPKTKPENKPENKPAKGGPLATISSSTDTPDKDNDNRGTNWDLSKRKEYLVNKARNAVKRGLNTQARLPQVVKSPNLPGAPRLQHKFR